jgi:Putative prokaryotic signal transducing protein
VDVVRLTIVENELDAELVCGLLRTEGIACSHPFTDTAAATLSTWSAGGGAVEVLVGEDDLERARAVLASVEPD